MSTVLMHLLGSSATITVVSDAVAGILLTDSNGATLGEVASENGTASLSDVTIASSGQYYVTVFAASGDGDYDITLSIKGAAVDVAPTEIADVSVPANDDIVTSLAPSTDILINNGMEVRLQWDAEVDLNLEVRDPRGNTLYFDSRTSPIGGVFGFDANGFCEVISAAPAETATWQPGFLPSGSYEILVFYNQSCESVAQATSFTVSITVNGQALDTIQGVIQAPPSPTVNSVYLANFVVATDGTATVNSGGAYPDTAINQLSIPAADLVASAIPITRDVVVQGAIFEEQDFVVYTFGAQADEVVSVSMNATSGNLDTLLQLLDPNGNLIAVNDDANGTNSLINNIRIIQTGNYVVVATRYGKGVGGTEGEFELLVSETSAALPAAIADLNLPPGDIRSFSHGQPIMTCNFSCATLLDKRSTMMNLL
ncbi:MAG: PPC domain-containing protein [Anaerolineae bacterium]|nr:PPC domain-containing protein [Anaerolineae bacterium]